MNARFLCQLVGCVLLLPLGGLGICFVAALTLDGPREGRLDPVEAFGISLGCTLALALVLMRLGRNCETAFRQRDSYALVGLGWVSCILCGTLPYVLCEPRMGWADALFESVSGFTATGATVISGLDSLPRSLLLWRAMTQWMAGMGVLILIVALISKLGAGSKSLFRHESSTFDPQEARTSIRALAKEILGIYIGLTAICFLGLWLWCEPGLFDSVCHTFTTVATGGFSTHDRSIAHFDCPRTEIWIMIFMALSAINFLLYVHVVQSGQGLLGFFWSHWVRLRPGAREGKEARTGLREWWREWRDKVRGRRRWWQRWRNDESMIYMFVLLAGSTLLAALVLFREEGADRSFAGCLRMAAFQATALMTTTGFATEDYDQWPALAILLLVVLMVIGGSAGSTSGGLKVGRVILFFKILRYQLRLRIRPRQVMHLRLNGNAVSEAFRIDTQFLIATASASLLLGTVLVCVMEPGMDLRSCFSAALATLFNIGPALGDLGPTETYAGLNAGTKVLLSFLMLLGRFEFFTFLVLFMPTLWRKH